MPPIEQTANEIEKKEVKPHYKRNLTRNPGRTNTLEGPETGLFYTNGR